MKSAVELFLIDCGKPKHLTKEEEFEHLRKAQEGDLQSRDKLYITSLPWIFSVCRSYVSPGNIRFGDCLSEAFLGFIEAINKFDWSRGTRLRTCAFQYIRKNILRFLREDRVVRIPLKSLDYRGGKLEENRIKRIEKFLHVGTLPQEDVIRGKPCDTPEYRDYSRERRAWASVVPTLSKVQREVAERRKRGEKFSDISAAMGFSKQYAHQLIQDLKDKLAKHIAQEGS